MTLRIESTADTGGCWGLLGVGWQWHACADLLWRTHILHWTMLNACQLADMGNILRSPDFPRTRTNCMWDCERPNNWRTNGHWVRTGCRQTDVGTTAGKEASYIESKQFKTTMKILPQLERENSISAWQPFLQYSTFLKYVTDIAKKYLEIFLPSTSSFFLILACHTFCPLSLEVKACLNWLLPQCFLWVCVRCDLCLPFQQHNDANERSSPSQRHQGSENKITQSIFRPHAELEGKSLS